MPLKSGKLPPDILARLLTRRGVSRPEVLVRPSVGEDSAVIDVGERVVVLSTDPITAATSDAGWLAVHVACNDVAANGAEPLGVLVTLFLPTTADLKVASELMADVDRAAHELGIEVLGGHTEVTTGLERPIVSVTSVGTAPRKHYVTSAGARPGHVVLLTKAAGIEGTAILAADFGDELRSALGVALVERALGLRRLLSVVAEGVLAARSGASALHDVTEGGVLGAAYELGLASGVGLEIDADQIPVLPETQAICRHLGLDPLRLIGSGAMLIAAPAELEIDKALGRRGIPATVVGWASDNPSAVRRNGQIQPLTPPEDELYRFLESRRSKC